MTLISIKNTSAGNTIIPARGGLGLVVGAGDEATVCPEGLPRSDLGESPGWSISTSSEYLPLERRSQPGRLVTLAKQPVKMNLTPFIC